MTSSAPSLISGAQPPASWRQDAAAHLWMPYCQMKTAGPPLPVVATEDVYLVLEDGRRLIDGMASWWAACHGYNHPHIARCVQEQLATMPHVMFGGIQHPQAARLARRLAGLLPGSLDHVFLCDSGSVSVEVAMKMAVQYHLNHGRQGRNRFLAFHHAYHGDTTGAMSLCDPQTSMHAHFSGLLLQQWHRELPHDEPAMDELDDWLRKNARSLAAVIIEPLIQGAGGMRFHSPEVLRGLRSLCTRHGVLLIADEIATGFGRTGSLFACQQADVVPDIICLGKALTGGTMTLAATVATAAVFEAFYDDDPARALMHGPTFMANPLACAAANASLDLFETEPRLEQAKNLQRILWEGLQPCAALSSVADVRTLGAVGVVQVKQLSRVEQIIAAGVQRGIWIRPFKDVVYVTPPLTIRDEVAGQLCRAVVEVMQEWDAVA